LIKTAFLALERQGFQVVVVVSHALVARVDQQAVLFRWENGGRIVIAPHREDDDLSVLRLAHQGRGTVLSNDHFRDYARLAAGLPREAFASLAKN
jgi:hypothetical protein